MEIELKNVSFRRRKKKAETFQLRDLSFKVEEGYMTGLVGVNGAGKTTLFHMLMNVLTDYEGEILLNGKDIRSNYEDRQKVGFISEEPRFIMKKSLLENAALMGYFYDDYSEIAFKEQMERLEVPYAREFGKCSRGEKIKFQLAFALAHDSRLLLIDEGTAGMDPVYKKEFFRFLHSFMESESHTVLMSTHQIEEVNRHMDHLLLLKNGRAELVSSENAY